MKRCLDIAVAGLALVLLSPAMLVLALCNQVLLGGPILFRQERSGRNGRPFLLYKLRTMTDAVDRDGAPLADHARLTRYGRFMRSSSLDELPQLFNVLRGDMSLVGPRPLLPEYLSRYSREQARRLEVPQGLTGWAQTHGRNALSWDDKLRLDVWYVDHRSFCLDLKILWVTGWQVVRGRGVRAAGHATMPKFTGSETPALEPSAPDPIEAPTDAGTNS